MNPLRPTQITAFLAAIFAACSVFAAEGVISEAPSVVRWKADPTTIFESGEVDLDDFRWIARPVIVFADTPANPAFNRRWSFCRPAWTS